MHGPIYMRDRVRVECDSTRFVWDRPGPYLCAIPACWWEPDSQSGGLSPLCDADGLILGKVDPVGVPAVLRWDHVTGYRVPPDGIVSVMCDLKYEGGSGTVFGWGGKFLESDPLEKLRVDIQTDGSVRFVARPQNISESCTAIGPILSAGWHEIRADLNTITGEICLTVDGIAYPAQYGTPLPFAPHWSDTLYFGSEAGDWGVQMLYRLPAGRLKNCGVRGAGTIWTVAALTDTIGPLMTYRNRYSDHGSPSSLDSRGLLCVPWTTNPIDGWGFSGATLTGPSGGTGIYITNSQNFKLTDVRLQPDAELQTGTVDYGLRMEREVYDGKIDDLRIRANTFGIMGIANAGQSCEILNSTIAGATCGTVFDSWAVALVGSFVKDIGAGKVGGFFGRSSRGGWTRVACYNEGGTQQFANVVTCGENHFTDCTIHRPGNTGPVLAILAGKTPKVTGLPMVGSILNLADVPFNMG